MQRALFPIAGLVIFVAIQSGFVLAADWPGWRGPRRHGVMDDWQPPASWPERLKRDWDLEVGLGHASPVFADGRIFVFSRLEDRETISSLSPDGKLHWQKQYDAPYKVNPVAEGHGKGPKATPLVAHGNVYTFGIGGILSCWSAESGELRWRREFGDQFPSTSPLYGTAASPLASGDLVLTHVGGNDGGAFVALRAESGETAWSWDKDGPAYTSPIHARLADTPQIVTQTQTRCISLSPDGKLLWTIPYETQYVQNIITPVVHGDLAIFSGYQRGMTAYRVSRDGERLSADEAWHTDEASLYMSSPVVVGNRLFGFSQLKRGQLFCLDPTSGKMLWSGPPRQGDNASLLAAGNMLLSLTNEGQLVVVDTSADEYRELARYTVADTPTWAHPLILGEQIFIKDESKLTAWRIGEE